MKTAVEWLEDCLTEQYPNGKFVWNRRADIEALFKQAKEMEKQQIIDSVYYTCSSMTHYDLPCGEQYYNETFKK